MLASVKPLGFLGVWYTCIEYRDIHKHSALSFEGRKVDSGMQRIDTDNLRLLPYMDI